MGNKFNCSICNSYIDNTLDKKESLIIPDDFDYIENSKNQFPSSRISNTNSIYEEKACLIQVYLRKLRSLKILKMKFLKRLIKIGFKEKILIYETSRNNFLHNIEDEIKEILKNKIAITSLEKTNIQYIIHNFKNIPSEKILNDLKVFKVKLDPIIITNEVEDSEIYWGEWNLKNKKHGFGFLISTKQDFYLGTFKDNIMDGVGLMIINNQNLSPEIKNDNFECSNSFNNKTVSTTINNFQNRNSQNHKLDKFSTNNNFIVENNNDSDNSLYKSFKVNQINNIIRNSKYFPDNENSNFNSTENYKSGNKSIIKCHTENVFNKENCSYNNVKSTDKFYSDDNVENQFLLKFNRNTDLDMKYESKISDFSKKFINNFENPKNEKYQKKEEDKINYVGNYNNKNIFSDNTNLACDIYIGEFKKGVADGYGRLFQRNGQWYIGYFKNNKKDGEGEIHFSDGSFYIGNFKNDNLEGEGKYFFSDGSYFSGNFKDNKIHGQGKMAWSDGRMFYGTWENNLIHGKGTHMWVNQNIYEGEYKNNVKSGKGIFYWNDKKYFEGDFLNNKINGKGFLNKESIILRGFWKFGKLNVVDEVKPKNKAFTCDDFFNTNTKEFKIQKADTKEGNEKNVGIDTDILPIIIEG